ncbi:PREDICTED: pentatricopeptide repeat-containing [Prunus dulcis]|uniref:PREDICTED: pentatricopeptide repeat-containing n=2 Tax=Prunus dulcis TaxID=3755 RepID=A0A5E4FUQ8_PRUDU|nr:pentatricopeptide repeat-containing protein At1g09220, mitochondrial-like [Prunus dulcis]VVA31218.1 PREDICTED: pentatricopeptide repeat-containing [Prunus dulcis]
MARLSSKGHSLLYFVTQIPTLALCFSSSSSLSSAPIQIKHPRHLASILLKNPTSRSATQQIHSHILTSGFLLHHSISTAHLLLFNTLLRCYSFGPFPRDAFTFYKHLQHFSLSFDSFTYSFLLHASIALNSTNPGAQIHALTHKLGFHFHVYVQTALLNMYAACGSLLLALHVFYEMPERNSVTWNVMITSLAKWGELKLARSLFDQMPAPTVVSCTAIIDAYSRKNQPRDAVALFRRMVVEDHVEPTEVTLLAIFPAVSVLGALKICQSLHAYGEKRGFNASDIRVTNSLLDSYAKCGCIDSASRLFEEIPVERKNLVSWTSIISGFAMHGMGKEAVEYFNSMEKVGLKPNRVTFLSIFNACSHGRLIDEGLNFFGKMVDEYEIALDIKHYGCLIDMLGRAGRLEEAENMALEIPSNIVNVVIWRTLLGACSFHGNVEMGERVTKKILEMERGYGGDYVLMSNIFAGVGRFSDAERMRSLLDERNAFKLPGHSLV